MLPGRGRCEANVPMDLRPDSSGANEVAVKKNKRWRRRRFGAERGEKKLNFGGSDPTLRGLAAPNASATGGR